ncbi:hypothetical protein KC19_8G037800 [Ceratodon purpureus]|uniref:GRAM domain-containing protein n=1 Tax=Ceratodon purpureus TaxID=3225 RepID=A0A8T0GV00_CERPU|nr:hypothetical protein KC19_8G037800 [Ceratodon purpureus]KAG0563521.1 hypothetical protein KC19_8G037800 [Ceratodon purpureus]
MSYGYPNQGPPPSYNSTFDDGEPLFTSPPEERYPSMKHTPYQHSTSIFGAPPMGEPSEPSAHPDNKTAATQTAGPSSVTGGPSAGGYNRQSTFENPTASWSGGAHDASPGAAHYASTPSAYQQQTASQPGVAGTVPAGVQPGSPYVQTQSVPATGTSPLNSIVENFNKYMGKAEVLAGNIWSHMKTNPSVLDAAQGRMSQGFKLVQEGGFEGLYKSSFGFANGEQLRKTYACYLSTSTGPVAGTLYISNLKFAFCSDRPLAYQSAPGQQAWSYYKVSQLAQTDTCFCSNLFT